MTSGITGDTASSIDPLALPRVKEALETLTKLDGLDLYYCVLAREVTAVDPGLSGAAALVISARSSSFDSTSTTSKPSHSSKEILKQLNLPAEETFSGLALDLMIMRSALDKREKELKDQKGETEKEDNSGQELRRALAKAIREIVSLKTLFRGRLLKRPLTSTFSSFVSNREMLLTLMVII